MKLHFLKRFWLLCFSCLGIFLLAQYTIPDKPSVLYPIYDEVGILSQSEKEKLNQKLIKFEDSTSTEIEVVIISSTKGEDINFLATKFGQKWGIGKKGVDNGVVFLIATEDRTMSIQQGRAVEQYLTASVAGQILDYLVTPNFRKGNWYEGINQGTDAIIEAAQGKFQKKKNTEDDDFPMIMLISIILFIVILILIIKNNNGGRGGKYFDVVIISGRGRKNYPGGFIVSPKSGGFGSSGGFGGFGGGGSFGGGGASGGW